LSEYESKGDFRLPTCRVSLVSAVDDDHSGDDESEQETENTSDPDANQFAEAEEIWNHEQDEDEFLPSLDSAESLAEVGIVYTELRRKTSIKITLVSDTSAAVCAGRILINGPTDTERTFESGFG
jgi:hypothetical protein